MSHREHIGDVKKFKSPQFKLVAAAIFDFEKLLPFLYYLLHCFGVLLLCSHPYAQTSAGHMRWVCCGWTSQTSRWIVLLHFTKVQFVIRPLVTPAERLLQLSSLRLMIVLTSVFATSLDREYLIAMRWRSWNRRERLTAVTWEDMFSSLSTAMPRSNTVPTKWTIADFHCS